MGMTIVISASYKKQRCCNGRGVGARSISFGVFMIPKWRVGAAHGRIIPNFTNKNGLHRIISLWLSCVNYSSVSCSCCRIFITLFDYFLHNRREREEFCIIKNENIQHILLHLAAINTNSESIYKVYEF